MKRASFSLALIIASNVLIIAISMVYGLQLFSLPQNAKMLIPDIGEYKELAFKK